MATHPQFGAPMTPSMYADEWKTAASNFAVSGDYAWMAERLGKVNTVLEVGGGSGESSAALLGVSSSLVVIDNNSELLQATDSRLTGAGAMVVHASAADFPLQPNVRTVRLLAASILDVSSEAMFADGTLDAIAVWLIGASPYDLAPALHKDVMELEQPDMAAYRHLVQAKCLELGKRWLRPGGYVHLVDRSVLENWQRKDVARDDTVDQYQSLAGEGYSVAKEDVLFRRLAHLGRSGIQSVETERHFSGGVRILSSVRLRKL